MQTVNDATLNLICTYLYDHSHKLLVLAKTYANSNPQLADKYLEQSQVCLDAANLLKERREE